MTDSKLLRQAVEKSGLKKAYIAQCIGLSYQGYLNKEKGESEFRQSEIEVICKLLDLTLEEKEAIFFATEVA